MLRTTRNVELEDWNDLSADSRCGSIERKELVGMLIADEAMFLVIRRQTGLAKYVV